MLRIFSSVWNFMLGFALVCLLIVAAILIWVSYATS